MLLKKGDLFDEEKFLDSFTEIKNTKIFPKIEYKITESKDIVDIIIDVEEGFYFIPLILPAASKSGYEVNGVLINPNFMGMARTIALAYTYKSRSESHSLLLGFADKKVLGSNFRIGGEIKSTNKVNIFSESSRENETYLGAWAEKEILINPVIKYGFLDGKFAAGVELYKKNVSVFTDEKYLDDELIDANSQNSFISPNDSDVFMYGPNITYSNLEYDGLYTKGY